MNLELIDWDDFALLLNFRYGGIIEYWHDVRALTMYIQVVGTNGTILLEIDERKVRSYIELYDWVTEEIDAFCKAEFSKTKEEEQCPKETTEQSTIRQSKTLPKGSETIL